MRKKWMALVLALMMAFTVFPASAFLDSQQEICNHVHDADCGYQESADGVACNMGCSEIDEDGNIIHQDGCTYAPAVEGQACSHVHNMFCGGLPEEEEPDVIACALTEGCTLPDGHEGECVLEENIVPDEEDDTEIVIVSEFKNLKASVAEQMFEIGVDPDEINLPSRLVAFDAAEDEIRVKVEWECEPAFDADCEGAYLFTPVIGDGYTVAEDVELPQITVELVEELPDDIALLEEEEQEPYEQTTTANIVHEDENDETSKATVTIESYLTENLSTTTEVKPCDFIFLLEQSKWMNTLANTSDYGGEREEIINSIKNLMTNIVPPTGENEEHRVAVVGYGRINNAGTGDKDDQETYPGQHLTPDQNPSLNTGYYTYDGDELSFHSQSGWGDVDQDGAASNIKLPTMPTDYVVKKYDDVFMTTEAAAEVLDPDDMVAWYSSATRMDAGFAITEALVDIAKKNDPNRNLIICIAASALPNMQDTSTKKNFLRAEAAKAAGNGLKDKGATIFILGDYHQSLPNNDKDTLKNFNSIMTEISGNKDTTDKDGYFVGLSQCNSVSDAMTELITKVEENVSKGESVPCTVTAKEFQEGEETYFWSEVKEKHNIREDETAYVSFYKFTGYDENDNPQFAEKPTESIEVPIKELENDGGTAISYNTKLIPIPHADSQNTAIGYKVVIQFTDPVEITYKWVGVKDNFNIAPPETEYVSRGGTHVAPDPRKDPVEGYIFDGWYTDKDCTEKYEGVDEANEHFTVYGKWLPTVTVTYHWEEGKPLPEGSEVPESETIVSGKPHTPYLPVDADDRNGYKFDGWYIHDPGNAEGNRERYRGSDSLEENLDLCGTWARTHYTVSYDLNGGTEDPKYNPETVSSGAAVTVKEEPTYSGHTFLGWKVGNETYKVGDVITITDDDITLVAQWKENSSSSGGSHKPNKPSKPTKPTKPETPVVELNKDEHFQYVQGYPDGTVKPDNNITRAEATLIFFRLLKDDSRAEFLSAENSFPDVNLNDWYNVGVSTMENAQIVTGYEDGYFRPQGSITRAELATIISNFDELSPSNDSRFSDISGHWAEKYINSAVEKGWIAGYEDGTFRPDQPVTRAETMAMINRVLDRRVNADGLHPDAKLWPDNRIGKWYYYDVLEATNYHDFERADAKDYENWTAIRPNKIWEN